MFWSFNYTYPNETLLSHLNQLYQIYYKNIDFDYVNWLYELIKPFFLFCLLLYSLPIIIIATTYSFSLFMFIYKHKNRLQVSIYDFKY